MLKKFVTRTLLISGDPERVDEILERSFLQPGTTRVENGATMYEDERDSYTVESDVSTEEI